MPRAPAINSTTVRPPIFHAEKWRQLRRSVEVAGAFDRAEEAFACAACCAGPFQNAAGHVHDSERACPFWKTANLSRPAFSVAAGFAARAQPSAAGFERVAKWEAA